MDKNVIISTRTILSVLVLLGLLWVAIQIKAVILILFLAFVVALGLFPLVEWLQDKGLPKVLAVILTLASVGGAFISLVGLAFSPLISQTRLLIQQLPVLVESVTTPALEKYLSDISSILTQQIAAGSNNVIQITVGAASGLVTAIMIFFLAGYLMMDMESIHTSLINVFPKNLRKLVENAYLEIEHRLGSWLRGQLLLMLIIGLTSFVGLTILQVDFALSLAVLSGLLEIIPGIGPVVATVPAAIVGFAISPVTGFGVLALFLLVQQVENNLIVPKVMEKTVGFNPIVTIIALLVGGKLFGLMGAILAIPVTLVLIIVIKNVLLGYENHYRK